MTVVSHRQHSAGGRSKELLEQLFRDEYDTMLRLAYVLLRNQQDAEEVVQDAFLDDWAQYQNCSNPQNRLDTNGNRITTYETCESTLVHVETVGAEAWAQEIDGQHPIAYALTIMSMPR